MIKPFKLRVPNNTLNKIYDKVKKYPWANIQDMNDWKHGTNFKYLKKISRYWVTKFNWRKQEKKINKFSNYLTKVDDINIHFIKEKGSGSNPMPLLILHGWPGSIVEFLNIIEKLAHPERYGGKKEGSGPADMRQAQIDEIKKSKNLPVLVFTHPKDPYDGLLSDWVEENSRRPKNNYFTR